MFPNVTIVLGNDTVPGNNSFPSFYDLNLDYIQNNGSVNWTVPYELAGNGTLELGVGNALFSRKGLRYIGSGDDLQNFTHSGYFTITNSALSQCAVEISPDPDLVGIGVSFS